MNEPYVLTPTQVGVLIDTETGVISTFVPSGEEHSPAPPALRALAGAAMCIVSEPDRFLKLFGDVFDKAVPPTEAVN